LVSSTVLTLLVLPTLYNLVEGARERRHAKRAGRGDAAGGTGTALPAMSTVHQTRRSRREGGSEA